ncbi:MAG: extracellular solute-binding protein [Armatimonadota bacterium]|nr:extracellular solute-binding protein [Armatimonadota bacterium]MDR7520012.1 extracellular solute-binding protein [Armatimonadota bacterium]MDR7549225.1 extracellular solute-binding protein [Armatimonadota bacterium]
MERSARVVVVSLIAFLVGSPAVPVLAQAAVEDRFVILTPAPRLTVDPTAAAFTEHVRRQYGVHIRVIVVNAGTPVAYGRIREWGGRPEADLFWSGEPALYDDLAERRLLVPHEVPDAILREIPPSIGTPKSITLKDPRGFWVGSVLVSYGLVWNPRLLRRLGIDAIRDWDDLLDCRLKGQIAQATPDRSSTNHSSYEVILQLHGWQKGWEWAQRLGANTGIFVAGSRDVPTVVAKGEFAVGFAVPVTMAFDDFRSGFDIRFVHPTAGYVTPEPMAVLAGARSPRAARAFIQWALSDEGQRLFMSVGLFSIIPKYRMEGPPGSPLDRMAQFSGVRSFYDRPIRNVYDEDVAQKRYGEVNAVFRKLILERHDELKRLHCR